MIWNIFCERNGKGESETNSATVNIETKVNTREKIDIQ